MSGGTSKGFDKFLMVDWSGGNDRGPRPTKDAIWSALATATGVAPGQYHRNRQVAEAYLLDQIDQSLAQNQRLCIGFDFPFGFPQGTAQAMCGAPDIFSLWAWFADRIEDTPKANNRFDVAAEFNQRFPGDGPFWFNGLKRDIPDLPRKKPKSGYGTIFPPERRMADLKAKGAFPVWQLGGAGGVGGQVLMGLPMLHRLRAAFPTQLAIAPFEPVDRPIIIVEIWPSLILGREPKGTIRDQWQVEQLALCLSRLRPVALLDMLAEGHPEEGWILGLGQEDRLIAALESV